MKEKIRQIFAEEHLSELGFLPITHAKIINPHLMPADIKSVVIFAVPYDLGQTYSDGVSAYAHIRDYHRYFGELFDRVLPELCAEFPDESFYGFADHSPIAEKDAAAKAGLGMLGKHSLLIHPRYGSYVFLGSILTSMKIPCSVNQALLCLDCGKCAEMCPAMAISERGVDVTKCFSALSQKKKLTDEESQTLRQHHIAWGCDVCQKACPHNTDRKHTDIPFFIEQRHGGFCAQEIEAMSDAEFAQYAFSWRGKNRILQNLQNLADE